MLREDQFEVIGYCYYCGNFRYSGPTGKIYHTCYCCTPTLKPRKLTLVKNEKPKVQEPTEEKQFEYKGYTA